MPSTEDYVCMPCEDGVHDLCEDQECTCDEAEHPDRPETS